MRAVCILALWLICGTLSTLADEELLMSMEQISENLSRYEGLAQSTINPSEMTLEALASGMEYYDSLIQSGHGTVSYYSPRASEKLRMHKSIFTFSGRRMRSDILNGYDVGEKMIYNGEFQITILVKSRGSETKVIVSKNDQPSIDVRQDPRAWYLVRAKYYLENPLHKRLRAPHTRLVSKEYVDGRLCYVVNESSDAEAPNLSWICPDMGFRILRNYVRIWAGNSFAGSGGPVAAHYQYKYKVFEQDGKRIWFPQRVEYTLLPLDKDGMAKMPLPKHGPDVFTVYDDFEINVDISEHFKLRFPPGTQIFDVASRRYLPVEQIYRP